MYGLFAIGIEFFFAFSFIKEKAVFNNAAVVNCSTFFLAVVFADSV